MPSDVIAEVFWRNTDEPPVSDNGQFTFIYASPYTLLGLIQVGGRLFDRQQWLKRCTLFGQRRNSFSRDLKGRQEWSESSV